VVINGGELLVAIGALLEFSDIFCDEVSAQSGRFLASRCWKVAFFKSQTDGDGVMG